MKVKIHESWNNQLQAEFEKSYFKSLASFVRDEYATHQCFPPGNQIFNAFSHCQFNDLKVVLLGQDPYHDEGQAHGLCFSVNEGIKHPPSLVNIFKEIEQDLGIPYPKSHVNCKGSSSRKSSKKRMGRIYRYCYKNNQ